MPVAHEDSEEVCEQRLFEQGLLSPCGGSEGIFQKWSTAAPDPSFPAKLLLY